MTTLDGYGTITADAAAMRLREATRNFLRALEDYHGLPHSFQRVKERQVAGIVLPEPSTPIIKALNHLMDAGAIELWEYDVLSHLPISGRCFKDLQTFVKNNDLGNRTLAKKMNRLLNDA